MSDTAGTDKTSASGVAAGTGEHGLPSWALGLLIFAILFPLALLGVTHIHNDALDSVAETLSAKHDVEFTVGERGRSELVPWTIDGVKTKCVLTVPALLCLDGSVYER